MILQGTVSFRNRMGRRLYLRLDSGGQSLSDWILFQRDDHPTDWDQLCGLDIGQEIRVTVNTIPSGTLRTGEPVFSATAVEIRKARMGL